MKKIIFLLILTLLPLVASAYDAQIDGIYYNIITKAKQAEVTSGDTKYTGSVIIPATVTYDDVTYSVTSIGFGAFSGCSGLTSVTMGSGVTSIGNYAFSGCSGLTSVTIGSGVASIGDYAFYECYALTSVHISDIAAWCKIVFNDSWSNPLCFANHLFMDDREITDLEIPDSVTSIGGRAFCECSSLTSVTIPNSVKSIGEYAFLGCSKMTSITIGNSVTSIGYMTFRNCYSLISVNIPNSVTLIGDWAFSDCSGLTSVIIGNSVTSIGDVAFRGCSGLTSITIPNSVSLIGKNTFSGCSKLISVTIPNSVTSMGDRIFYGCSSLTSVIIGSGLKTIGSSAFQSCAKLTDVYCYAENIPRTGSDVFKDSYIEYVTLYVPEISVTAYKAMEPWNGFGTIKAIGDVPVIEKCATPTISFADGKLTFDCDTEGVEYVSSITPPSAFNSDNKTVSVPTTYKVTVYATKSGYENSDVATKEIEVSSGGIKGDVNEDGTVNGTDIQEVINIIVNEE